LDIYNLDITEAEVLYAVKSLKNNKACGGDLILNEFLKHATVKLMPVFVRICNIVFHSGIVPDSWSEGYKKTSTLLNQIYASFFQFIYNRLLIFSKLSVKRTIILSTTNNNIFFCFSSL
jgi:hypothetical protein